MKPPRSLVPLAAALLCGAVLAQAAKPAGSTDARPADHSAASSARTAQSSTGKSTSQTSTGNAATGHASTGPASTGGGLLGTPVNHRGSGPQPAKRRTTTPPAPTVEHDWNLTAHGKVLYLTFDDGPQHVWTPKILQVLRKHHAHATFFVIGIQVEQFPELVTAERAAGHRVGNHTYDHKTLTGLPAAKVRQEIGRGVPSKCLRPPTGASNATVRSIAASYHQRQVLWDVDTDDWMKPGAASIEHAILSGARPGAIILMHDGGGNRSQTVAALDRALTKLSRQGYTYRSLPC